VLIPALPIHALRHEEQGESTEVRVFDLVGTLLQAIAFPAFECQKERILSNVKRPA
jgi:hypothetical protein